MHGATIKIINTGVSNNVAVSMFVKAAGLDCFIADAGFTQRHIMNTLYITHDHSHRGWELESPSNVGNLTSQKTDLSK